MDTVVSEIYNMKVRDAETFYCESVVKNIFDIGINMTREQSRNQSLSTLSFYIDTGMTWWAPIPDSRYKSRDGRDLNLEVICSMMV